MTESANATEKPKGQAETKKLAAVSKPTPSSKRDDGQGRLQIDGFGLPVNAIARKRVLAKMHEEDPAGSKEWSKADEARKMTETLYG